MLSDKTTDIYQFQSQYYCDRHLYSTVLQNVFLENTTLPIE